MNTNFTTPDQSKRLLELGLPASSADCYYTQDEIEGNKYWVEIHLKREYQPCSELHSLWTPTDILPCWSIGQLIRIYRACGRPECTFSFSASFPDIMDEMMGMIEQAKMKGDMTSDR